MGARLVRRRPEAEAAGGTFSLWGGRRGQADDEKAVAGREAKFGDAKLLKRFDEVDDVIGGCLTVGKGDAENVVAFGGE